MPVATTSILDGVTAILGSVPPMDIEPILWRELIKLRQALTELASAADLVNAQIAEQSELELVTTGTLVHKFYLGELMKLAHVQASSEVPATAGFTLQLRPEGGTIKAYKAWNGFADAFTTDTPNVYLLRGLAFYPRTVYPLVRHPYPNNVAGAHNRLAVLKISNTSLDPAYRGTLNWWGVQIKYYGAWYTGPWFIGTRIGYVGSPYITGLNWTEDLAQNALIYFNPQRA